MSIFVSGNIALWTLAMKYNNNFSRIDISSFFKTYIYNDHKEVFQCAFMMELLINSHT